MTTHRIVSGNVSSSQVQPADTPPGAPAASRRPQAALDAPPGLSGRHLSDRLGEPGPESQRIRQPLPEIALASPEHDGRTLLRMGERSDRFSSIGHDRHLSSGSPSLADRHGSSRFDDSVSESSAVRRWLQGVEPPAARGTPGELPLTSALQAPEAKRSWRSVANGLANGLKQLGNAALNEACVTLSIVKLPRIPKRLMGALAGHAIHQSVAVGIPTVVREMVGVGLMHALRNQPKAVAVGLQVTMGVANLAIQAMRELRELRRPDEAARAYFSLSAEEWAAKSPGEQAQMRTHHRRMSRALTVMQMASSITNLALMLQAFDALDPNGTKFSDHDRTAALTPLANEVKVGVYALMRDGIQATFSTVGFTPSPNAEPGREFAAGLRGPAHGAAAATYAAANAGAAFLADALKGAWVPRHGDAIALLMGDTQSRMGHAQAWRTAAMGAGVGALANVLAETVDWFQRTEHFVNQTGASQHWEPRMTGTDYGRLLDHAPTRAAAFNAVFSVLTLAGGRMGQSDLPPAVQQFIGNAGLGVMIAMLDSPVSGLWQAEEAVRAATAAQPQGSSVVLTELEDGDRPRDAHGTPRN